MDDLAVLARTTPKKENNLLLAFFYEALQAPTPICCRGLSPKAYRESCQDGTFTTSVVSNNEIDERPQFNLQEGMTHEIGASDAVNNTILCSLVVQQFLVPLLASILRCLLLETLFICGVF